MIALEIINNNLSMHKPFEMIKRTTLKLSTNLSEEEVYKAIAKVMGVSVDELPKLDFEYEKSRIRNESERVEKIIENYKAKLNSNSKTTKDKYDELYDIGKFTLFINDKIQIHGPEGTQHFPDFILISEDQRIGVEHTRLMSEDIRATFKTVKYYIAKAHELVANELNHLSKTVNIFISYDKEVIGNSNFKNRRFGPEERVMVARMIAEFIKSELTGGNVPKPAFIKQVEITSNNDSRIDFELAETYLTEVECSQLLLDRIAAKELKAGNYRNVADVNQLWLLIVIDDINSFSGFNIEAVRIPTIKESNFDNIFLFEKFGGKVYSIFPGMH